MKERRKKSEHVSRECKRIAKNNRGGSGKIGARWYFVFGYVLVDIPRMLKVYKGAWYMSLDIVRW